MYTIGQLGKTFRLSRSTLLYYDKIGLLIPSARNAANYRMYTQADFDRMTQINTYKSAGLSLHEIKALLDSRSTDLQRILEQRLEQLNSEIGELRQQQQIILRLVGNKALLRKAKVMSKKQWVNLLRASGMNDAAMHQWHVEFERGMPEAHTDFLQALGIDDKEIAKIKAMSKN